MKLRAISRAVTVTLVLTAGLVAGTGPATAAPPANDDVTGAVVVPGVPFTDTVDTTEATFAAGDSCGLATVWYRFTPNADMLVEFNTVGSDIDTTLGLYQGAPGSLELLDCNDDSLWYGFQSRIVAQLEAGTNYYVEAGSCCNYGDSEIGQVGPGGNLTLNVVQGAPPVSDVTLTLSRRATVTQGVVTLRGTIACDQRALYDMSSNLTQQFGRFVARGGAFDARMACGPTPVDWIVTLISQSGVRFGGGNATANLFVTAYDEESFVSDELTGQTVKLRPVRR